MAVLVVSTFEISGLTAPALNILKAAVRYAKENQWIQTHTMSIDAFCNLAGLQSLPVEHFWSLLREASGVLAIVEEVDTSAPNRVDLPYASWPVFGAVCIDGGDVMFEVCDHTFRAELLGVLQNLQA